MVLILISYVFNSLIILIAQLYYIIEHFFMILIIVSGNTAAISKCQHIYFQSYYHKKLKLKLTIINCVLIILYF